MTCLISVSDYRGECKPDKNGLLPMFVTAIAGSYPRSMMVISGSSAQMYELESGNNYYVSLSDTGAIREYTTHDGKAGRARNWNFKTLAKVINPVEMEQLKGLIGDALIINDVAIGSEINEVEPVVDAQVN